MGPDLSKLNADALERTLRARRRDLRTIYGEERDRRAFALDAIEGYTALLREPTEPAPSRNPIIRYCFKLVFPDGRWSIDEKQLPSAPQKGDVLDFAGYGGWCIQGSQQVGVRPAGKPPREFFVCAPAVS